MISPFALLGRRVREGEGRRDGHRLLLQHGHEYRDEVVDAYQVAVLVVADLPLGAVVDGDVLGQQDRLGEVDQPDVRAELVVDEEERAADHLGAGRFSRVVLRDFVRFAMRNGVKSLVQFPKRTRLWIIHAMIEKRKSKFMLLVTDVDVVDADAERKSEKNG